MVYLALLTYPILWFAFVVSRRPLLSPIGLFLVFYHMHYGPQSFYVDMMRITINLPDFTNEQYASFMAGSNIAIALALGIVGARSPQKFVMLKTRVPDYVDITGIVILVMCYSAIHLMLDAPAFGRTFEHINFFLGRSSMSYEQIRRVFFADNFWQIAWNYTRNTFTPISFALLSILFIKSDNILSKIKITSIFIASFIMTSLSLTKFVYAYTAVVVFLAMLLYQRDTLVLSKRAMIWLAVASASSLGMIQILYFIQYSVALNRGYLSDDSLFSILWYRAFFAQSDALRLWLLEFPDQTPHIGFANIGVVAKLLDIDYFDPTTYLPMKYLGDGLTTLQTGFLGSTYASFGHLFTYLYAMLVVIGLEYAHRVGCRILFRDLRAVYFAVLLPNTYFINSREVSVALFSGGVVIVPLIVLFLNQNGLNKLGGFRRKSLTSS